MNAVALALPPRVWLPLAIGGVLLGGIAAAVIGPPVIVPLLGAGLLLAIARHPLFGAWLWLGLGPLVVGIARGQGAMVLRPNEALLLLLAAGIGLRVLWLGWRGERWWPPLVRIDFAVAGLTVAGSLVPLVLRYGRGLPVTPDDILYALVFVKYFLAYALIRLAVREPGQVASCLRVILGVTVVVGIVAILQVKDLAGVPYILDHYYDAPFTAPVGPITERGTSTLATPFGVADVTCMCIAIAIAWLMQGAKHRLLLLGAAAVFVGGCLAAGSFSGYIGIVVVTLTVGFARRRLLSLMTAMVPAGLVAAILFWPTVANRLEGFDSRMGLPKSWLGRVENLERFVWPELFSGLNWLWGVRPAARIPAPEAWRDWVYIESGHAWLLWAGGVPLLAAFLAMSWIVGRETFRTARHGTGPVAIAAAAALAGMAMIFTLMLFDPHLTVRGCADLFFPLMALAVVGQAGGWRADVPPHTEPDPCPGRPR